MSQWSPGWYADPQSPPTGQAVRWWDGQRWTEHVHYAQSNDLYAARDTTPDGEPLAGWWIRVGAYLIDWLILLVLASAVGFSFLHQIGSAYERFFHATMDAADAGRRGPSSLSIYRVTWRPLLAFGLLSLALNCAYHLTFLRWRGATPGKLVVGLQVRLRDQPGQLPWGAILRRWVVQFGPHLVALIPVVGILAGVFGWVDGLWPLWDSRRQALHDKFGRTNVVRTRRRSG